MGIINQGILGGVSGTVGNVVGSFWKGIPCLRIKAAHYNDAQSEVQVEQRNRFKAIVEFARSVMDTLIRPIWEKKAVKMSGFNLFLKTNIDVFDETGQLTDFENLRMSVGDLPIAPNIVVENGVAGNGAIVVTWEDNSGTGIAATTDQLRLVAMNGKVPVIPSGLNFTRDAGQAAIQLPYGAGEDVHVYVFFQNEGKMKYSPDFYALVTIPTTPTP